MNERLEALRRDEPCPPFRLSGYLGAVTAAEVAVYPRRLQPGHAAARYMLLIQDAAPELPPLIG